MTVVIIIDNQRSEPLDNHDSSDYYKQTRVWTTTVVIIIDYQGYEPLDNHGSARCLSIILTTVMVV
jgi:hypothetical protein